jgi:hypothetical protein
VKSIEIIESTDLDKDILVGKRESFTAMWIDEKIVRARRKGMESFFNKNERWLTSIGLQGLYLLSILGIIASIVICVRYPKLDKTVVLSSGVAWFVFCIIAHYISWKFLPGIRKLVSASPTKVASTVVLDSLGFMFLIFGAACLLSGIVGGIKFESIELFFTGLFGFIWLEYFAALSLNPKLMNVTVAESTTSGEEFLGLISVGMKGYLKMIPIIFGSGIFFGIFDVINLMISEYSYIDQILGAALQVGYVTGVAFLPLFGYIMFLAYYFIIDVFSAILAIPRKLGEQNS